MSVMSNHLGFAELAIERPATVLTPERLRQAKKAYTTRFVEAALNRNADGYWLESSPDTVPARGDVVLARVERIGQLPRLESPASRRQLLFVGDEILLAYGDRYAADHVHAELPTDLGPCHLAAAGGLASSVTAFHSNLGRPTDIVPLGILADAGGRVNLIRLAPRRVVPSAMLRKSPATPVLAVLGTSMNAGKSTAAASIIRGLTRSGLRVAAGKLTGTGAGGDPGLYADAGASITLDFTDFGYPSTYKVPVPELLRLADSLLAALDGGHPDVIVLEIADGIYQQETAGLLGNEVLRGLFDGVVFAASDALGAVNGVEMLSRWGLQPLAVTGVLTSSPLASAETSAVLGARVPVVPTLSFCEDEAGRRLLERLAVR